LALLGPFFAVRTHRAGDPVDAPWRPLSTLVDDPDSVESRVRRTREALSGMEPEHPVEVRVAASVTHLGLVARVLAPALGLAVLGHDGSALLEGRAWWQDVLGGPYPLSVEPPSAAATPLVVAGSWVSTVSTTMSSRYAVSPRVIWGNVASAVHSAARMVAAARPELGPAVTAVAEQLLDDPRIDPDERPVTPAFRRRSCCLLYRVSGSRAAVCGDCVLGP